MSDLIRNVLRFCMFVDGVCVSVHKHKDRTWSITRNYLVWFSKVKPWSHDGLIAAGAHSGFCIMKRL